MDGIVPYGPLLFRVSLDPSVPCSQVSGVPMMQVLYRSVSSGLLSNEPRLLPGRFDECVIEERRQCAEDLLQFSANIPALYNSSQLEDFFKGGEVHDGSDLIGPAEPFGDFPDSLSDCSSD
ncbi:hypothetical protein GDO81_029379, partial [Engystomops pustulosus]